MPSDMEFGCFDPPCEAHCDELRSEWNEEDSLMQHLRQLHGSGARLLGEAEDAMDHDGSQTSPKKCHGFLVSNDTQLNNANIHHIIHTSIIHIIHIIHNYTYNIYNHPWFILKMPVQCSALFDPWHTLNCQDGPIIAPLTSIEVELEVWDVFFLSSGLNGGFSIFWDLGGIHMPLIAIIFPIIFTLW